MCVGVDDGQMLGSGFVDTNPVTVPQKKHPLIEDEKSVKMSKRNRVRKN